MKDPGVDGCLPLVTWNCLSLALQEQEQLKARVDVPIGHVGTDKLETGWGRGREGMWEWRGGTRRGTGGGVLPSAKQRPEGLVSLSGQGRHSTGRDSTET